MILCSDSVGEWESAVRLHTQQVRMEGGRHPRVGPVGRIGFFEEERTKQKESVGISHRPSHFQRLLALPNSLKRTTTQKPTRGVYIGVREPICSPQPLRQRWRDE